MKAKPITSKIMNCANNVIEAIESKLRPTGLVLGPEEAKLTIKFLKCNHEKIKLLTEAFKKYEAHENYVNWDELKAAFRKNGY